MQSRSNLQTSNQSLMSPTTGRSPISAQERQFLFSILMRMSDKDVRALLKDRSRLNSRASSMSSSAMSQASALSLTTTPSLCGSSMSSNRASMMSVDGVQPQYNLGGTGTQNWALPETFGYTSELDPAGHLDQGCSLPAPYDYNTAIAPTKTGPPAKIPTYFCTYCSGRNIPSFQKRGDWKDHETDTHQAGRKYLCPHDADDLAPCRVSYLSELNAEKHHQVVHERQGCLNKCKRPRNLPVTIFACGFQGCFMLFKDDFELKRDAWSARCKHVAAHFEAGKSIDQWDYSHMIFTLLHQPQLHGKWDELALRRAIEGGFEQTPVYLWSAKNTHEMRRVLETEFCRPFNDANAMQFLSRVYELATFRFPGQRAIPNVDLRVASSDSVWHSEHDTNAATTDGVQTITTTPRMTDGAALVNNGPSVPEAVVLRSNRTPSSEDFTEGTLRPGRRLRGRSDASNPTTRTRSRSRSIKSFVSRALSTTNEKSVETAPPMPQLPHQFKSTMATTSPALEMTGLGYPQEQYGSHTQSEWEDDQLLLGAQSYSDYHVVPDNTEADRYPYYR